MLCDRRNGWTKNRPSELVLFLIAIMLIISINNVLISADYRATSDTIDDAEQYFDNIDETNSKYRYSEQEGYQDATTDGDAMAPERKWALERYRGFSLVRTVPQTEQHIELLQKFLYHPVAGVNFWQEPTSVNRTVDTMVSPEGRDDFIQALDMMELSWRYAIIDIGRDLIDGQSNQTESLRQAYRTGQTHTFFTKYRTFPEISEHLVSLKSKYEGLVDIVSLGNSFEERPLYMVTLSSTSREKRSPERRRQNTKKTKKIKDKFVRPRSTSTKPIIWIDAGHHAREWMSHATCMYIIENLLKDYKRGSKKVLDLFEKYDIYAMPVVNPDGYQYSHTHDRFWRKTRSSHKKSTADSCQGVDANRNYPHNWMVAGASSNPCDEIYAGPEALSEPETQALSKALLKFKDRVKLYLSMHAYGQYLLCPWGHDKTIRPTNYDELKSIADVTMKALYSVHGTKYKFGSSSQLLYPAAGGSDDFAMGVAGVKYAYTIELRDRGDHGFALPENLIIPTAEETYFGFVTLVEELIKRGEY